MTARLQAATSSKRPIILRTSTAAGHGFGTALSEQIEQNADSLAFLLHEIDLSKSQ
jgi:prolyl oligopeptidase